MKQLIYIQKSIIQATLLLLITILVSCETIHDFPGKDIADPTLIDVDIYLKLKQPLIMPNQDEEKTEITSLHIAKGYRRRVLVEVYKFDDPKTPVLRAKQVIENDVLLSDGKVCINAKLNATKYEVLVWVDYIKKEDVVDKFYNTHRKDGLHNISYITYSQSEVDSDRDERTCAYGSTFLDLTEYRDEWNFHADTDVNLKWPIARYMLIASDVDKYVTKVQTKSQDFTKSSIEDYTCKVTYNGFFVPSGINASTGDLSDAKTGITYDADVHIDEVSGEVVVGMGYPFVAKDVVSKVDITVSIYDENGELVNTNGDVKFDVERGKFSIYRGELFTRSISPGVTVDQNYDGVIDVVLPD